MQEEDVSLSHWLDFDVPLFAVSSCDMYLSSSSISPLYISICLHFLLSIYILPLSSCQLAFNPHNRYLKACCKGRFLNLSFFICLFSALSLTLLIISNSKCMLSEISVSKFFILPFPQLYLQMSSVFFKCMQGGFLFPNSSFALSSAFIF